MATDTAALAEPTAEPDPTRHVWQVPTFLLGVAVFVSAWQGWLPLGTPNPAADFARDLAALRSAYEKVTPDRDELKGLLARVASAVDSFPEQAPQARFTLGCGYVRLAELTPSPEEARSDWVLAKQHFDLVRAEQLGDPADGPRFAFRAAKARVAVGLPANATAGDIRLHMNLLAHPPLNEEPGDASRLQAELALRLSPPDLTAAREALTRFVTSAGNATPSATLARCRLQLAEIHTQQGEPALARKWLEYIGADAPPDVAAPAKALLARAKMAEEDWLGAAHDWETMRAMPGLPQELRSASAYHLGWCRVKTREPAAAAKMFEEAARGSGQEARAASARLAELYLNGGEPAKRLAVPGLLAATLKGVSAAKDYRNELLPVTELVPLFELAVSKLLADEAYEAAVKATEVYAPVAPVGRERERRGEVLAAWAAALKKSGGEFKPKAAGAAAEYEAFAGLQPLPLIRADLLRRAAGMYKLSGDPTRAANALRAATKLPDLPPDASAAVWSDLADALIAANGPAEEVWKAFNKAMEAAAPVSTAVRYRLGRQFIDSRNTGFAPLGRHLFEQIAKQENVRAEERTYHELALVGLGYEVMRSGNYSDAETWLRKQLGLYPTGSEAGLGRLFLGICLLQRTLAPGPSAPDGSTAGRMREEALGLFKQVVAEVEARARRDGKLGDRDTWLRLQAGLRVLQTYQQINTPKSRDDLLAEASVMLERHRGTVDELIILSLVYHAFKQKNQPGLALQTRDRMKEVFDSLPRNAFPGQGEYSREYWEKVWFTPEPK
jgi:hypothetical protein